MPSRYLHLNGGDRLPEGAGRREPVNEREERLNAALDGEGDITTDTYFIYDQRLELGARVQFPPESERTKRFSHRLTNGLLADARHRKHPKGRDRPYDMKCSRVRQMVKA